VGADQTDRSQTKHQNQRQRVTVAEAADILGITAEAVRTRIKRGKLESVKEPPAAGGTFYVLLEADRTRPNTDPTSQGQDQTADQTGPALLEAKDDLIATLREQLQAERQAHAEARRLLAAALERIPPQLEAANGEESSPLEARESPLSPGPSDTTSQTADGVGGREEAAERVSWWRRVLGG
jgi:predicted ArsR family transcriptional regulator